ncbi:hypothetical protein GCM10023319_46420 [Nocardia iowensis]
MVTLLSGLPAAAADTPDQMNALRFFSSNGGCLVPAERPYARVPPCLPIYDSASRWTKPLRDPQIRHVETGGCLAIGATFAILTLCDRGEPKSQWELHVLGENAGNIRSRDPGWPNACLHVRDDRHMTLERCDGSAAQWWTWAVV